MTVRELIEKLSTMNKDAIVKVGPNVYCFSSIEEYDVTELHEDTVLIVSGSEE